MVDLTADLKLVDHHCHGVTTNSCDPEIFQLLLTESHHPMRVGASYFDTPLGVALRRLCPPVLELAPHAGPDEYLARRAELGEREVAGRFLSRSGLESVLVDTGFAGDETTPADIGAMAGCDAHVVHRVEAIAERVLASHPASEFIEALRGELERALDSGVSFKSIVAYRGGLDFTPVRPDHRAVVDAVTDYRARKVDKLTSPVILRHLLYETLDVASLRGTPIQFHIGYGDNDVDLRSANPLLLADFIREAERVEVPIVLLHCYPFHREGGYLAATFPNVYFDIGLTIPHVGLGAERILAESLELSPFSKLLYSSDAALLPEFFYIAARLFKEAAQTLFGRWVANGEMSAADAQRFVAMIGAGNAHQVYPGLRSR